MRHSRRVLAVALSLSLGFVAGAPTACRSRTAVQGDDASAEDGAARVEVAPPVDAGPPRNPFPSPPPDVAAPSATAVTTASGLATHVLATGQGTLHPRLFDLVKLRYVGWLRDGTAFGASSPVPGGPPLVARVYEGGIPGLSEGLTLMVRGERRRLWIPAALASANRATPAVTIDVELLDILPTPEPPPFPSDALKPPAGARKTESGARWRLLSSSGRRETLTSTGIAVYNSTVWTVGGELLMSTYPEGHPDEAATEDLERPLNEVFPLLKVGDSARLWYYDAEGVPLVADVSLLFAYTRQAKAEIEEEADASR